jgi:hypothetical protein
LNKWCEGRFDGSLIVDVAAEISIAGVRCAGWRSRIRQLERGLSLLAVREPS